MPIFTLFFARNLSSTKITCENVYTNKNSQHKYVAGYSKDVYVKCITTVRASNFDEAKRLSSSIIETIPKHLVDSQKAIGYKNASYEDASCIVSLYNDIKVEVKHTSSEISYNGAMDNKRYTMTIYKNEVPVLIISRLMDAFSVKQKLVWLKKLKRRDFSKWF